MNLEEVSEADPFEVLEIDERATSEDVKAAFRRLAKREHPDHSVAPDSKARFDAVRQAYLDLSDPVRRAQAERRRREADEASVETIFGAFGKVLDDIPQPPPPSREPHPWSRRRKGVDVRRRLSLTLEQAFRGGRFRLPDAPASCSLCGGQGRVRTPDIRVCHQCQGHGRHGRSGEPCRLCLGTGGARFQACGFCAGNGSVAGPGVLVVVPPGVADGAEITVPKAGAPGLGTGSPGDMVVEVCVVRGGDMSWKGSDLFVPIRIAVWEAALGVELAVDGIDGSVVRVVVPPGTQAGGTVRAAGHGLRRPEGGRGDLVVTLNVSIPDASVEPYATAFAALRDRLGKVTGTGRRR